MQFVRTEPLCNLKSSVSELREKYLLKVNNRQLVATLHSPLEFKVIFDLVDQDVDPVPSHAPAFVVEIEVLILYFWYLELTRGIRILVLGDGRGFGV